MKLTYEEFQKLPMAYTFGVNADAYCARQYVNMQHRIVKEVVTDRIVPGDIYSGFKKPRVGYYKGSAGKICKTPRELWEHEYLTPWFDYPEHKPVRGGWYETDLGMVAWCGTHFMTGKFKQPKRWRGMRDVEVAA